MKNRLRGSREEPEEPVKRLPMVEKVVRMGGFWVYFE